MHKFHFIIFLLPFISVFGHLKGHLTTLTPGHSRIPQKLYSQSDTMLPMPVSPHELLGQFDPSQHPDFVLIPTKFGNKSGMYLRKEVMEAYLQLRNAAGKVGLPMKIVSATRNFDAQKLIWENKWTGKVKVGGKSLPVSIPNHLLRAKKIMEMSAMPGTSRHHWGTDVDFNSLENSWFSAGIGKQWYYWMLENGPKFGFCQTYTTKNQLRPNGYNEEKWHWSYIPLSKGFLKTYLEEIKIEQINGFSGSECAEELHAIQHYVSGISIYCQ